MASGKKGAKGNKTAHVLNLLTAPGGGAAAPTDEAPDGTVSPEAVQPAPSRPLVPPILEVAQANDESLAQQIQQALEEELLPAGSAPAPVPPAAPAPPPESPVSQEESPASQEEPPISRTESSVEPPPVGPADIPEEAAVPEASPSLEAALAQALESEFLAEEGAQPGPAPARDDFTETIFEDLSTAAPAPPLEPEAPAASAVDKPAQPDTPPAAPKPEPAPEAKPAPEPEPVPEPEKSSQPASADELTYVNVIQALVEEKAPRYIQMFGLCSCPRCKIDVVALTLNNLIPKYVVMKKHDMIPMLTVYEGRFSSTIFAQLTRACKIVSDHPRHTPEDLAQIDK